MMSWQRRSFIRPSQQTIRSAPGAVWIVGSVSVVCDVKLFSSWRTMFPFGHSGVLVELPQAASSGAVSKATARGEATRGSETKKLALIRAIKASKRDRCPAIARRKSRPQVDLDVVKPAQVFARVRTSKTERDR